MQLNIKHRQLLNEFIRNKTLSIEEIKALIRVQKRSVYNYINDLNIFLKSYNFNQISKFLDYGFTLNEDENKLIDFLSSHDIYIYNQNERIEIITLFILIYGKMELKKICDIFAIDIKTAKVDIENTIEFCNANKIKIEYSNNTLTLNDNNELEIRALIADIINTKKTYLLKFLKHPNNNDVITLINIFQKELKIFWTHNFVNFLHNFILILILRIKNSNNNFEFSTNLKLNNHKIINSLIEQFLKSNDVISTHSEISYFTSLLMCGNIIKSQKIDTIYPYKILKDEVDSFIDNFEKDSFLKINNKQTVSNDLVMHLIPCYYRSLLKMQSFLPFVIDIKNKYGMYFQLAKKHLVTIETKLKIQLHEVEIQYIILHLISNVSANYKKRIINIGLFCNHPTSIYKMVVNYLYENIDNIEISKIDDILAIDTNDFDLVLSTTLITNATNNVIYIKKFLDEFDITKIKEKIKEIKANTVDSENKIIYTLINQKMDEVTLINHLCKPLLNSYITTEYVDELVKVFNKDSKRLIINNNTIILHANPSIGVIKKGYAINASYLDNCEIEIHNLKIKNFIIVVPSPTLNHIDSVSKILELSINDELKKKCEYEN